MGDAGKAEQSAEGRMQGVDAERRREKRTAASRAKAGVGAGLETLWIRPLGDLYKASTWSESASSRPPTNQNQRTRQEIRTREFEEKKREEGQVRYGKVCTTTRPAPDHQ